MRSICPRTIALEAIAERKPIVDGLDNQLTKLEGELVERSGLAIVIFQNREQGVSR